MNFKKQDAQIKTQGFIKKGCFPFLAPILSACIITSSLIHEATTLMERLFKFLRPLFIGSRLWFKAMVQGYERKGISPAQNVFKGFKDLGSTLTIHQSLSLVVFIEE
jgi:hypothetical protein